MNYFCVSFDMCDLGSVSEAPRFIWSRTAFIKEIQFNGYDVRGDLARLISLKGLNWYVRNYMCMDSFGSIYFEETESKQAKENRIEFN